MCVARVARRLLSFTRGGSVRIALGVCLYLLVSTGSAHAAQRVLILLSESPTAPGAMLLRDRIEQALQRDGAEVFSETLDTTRFPAEPHERALATLLATKYATAAPNLIVPVAYPALDFLLRHRTELFPAARVLFGLVDARMVAGRELGDNVTGVYVRVDAARTLQSAKVLFPKLRRVVVVGGASPSDRAWMGVVREDLRYLDMKLEIVEVAGRPLKEALGEIGALGDDEAVLYVTMALDGSGIGRDSPDVLRVLRRATDVPIFGLSATYLGAGAIGGVVLDFRRVAEEIVEHARQLLADPEISLPAPTTVPSLEVYDWRELERFGIGETALPKGTTIANTPRGFVDEYGFALMTMAAVAILSLAVGVAFVERRKHLRNEETLVSQRQVTRVVEELLAAFAAVPLQRLDAAISSALHRAAQVTGATDLWIWEPRDDADRTWMSLPLHSGETVIINRGPMDAAVPLPPPVEARAAEKGYDPTAIVTTPLVVGDELLGVLFWVSTSGSAPAHVVKDLRVIGETLAQALQRKRADGAIEQSERLKNTVLSSLVSSIAVLDRDGVIIEVNEAWKRFARSHGIRDMASVMPGASYRRECERAVRDGVPEAGAVLTAIQRACAGETVDTEIEYRMDGTKDDLWFALRASPLIRDEGGAVVIHRDITAQKHAERVLHTVSGRLIAAQEGERRRIARELHDDLGQRVALLAIEIDQAAAEAHDGVSERIRALGERTADLAVEIHRLSHALHSSKLDALGLAAAVRGHCREMGAAGLDVTFLEGDVPSDLPSDVSLCLFRVVQEALNNVAKHSGTNQAEVELGTDEDMLEARITDQGRGFNPGKASEDGGLGLVGMRERLAALGGTLIVESFPGVGTTVWARVPLSAVTRMETSDELRSEN